MPVPADVRPVLRDLVRSEATAVDPDPVLVPVMAQARRFRRRRRVAAGAVAAVLAIGSGTVIAAAVDRSPGERTSTYATAPSSAPAPPPVRSYRVWSSSDVVPFPEVGLTLEASSVEYGPVAPGIYTHEVLLRADRPVDVESVRFVGQPGVAAMQCSSNGGEDEQLCDEPDRSVDGDGWSLRAGDAANVTLRFDTEVVAHRAQVVVATVATSVGTIQVPIHLDVLATDEAPANDTVAFADGEGPGTVRLRPPDWRATVEARSSNAFTGAPYRVVDATGATVSTGSAGFYGEAILTLEPGRYAVRIDRLADGRACGFSVSVDAVASSVQDVELTCPA
jgi:hypothetical protein